MRTATQSSKIADNDSRIWVVCAILGVNFCSSVFLFLLFSCRCLLYYKENEKFLYFLFDLRPFFFSLLEQIMFPVFRFSLTLPVPERAVWVAEIYQNGRMLPAAIKNFVDYITLYFCCCYYHFHTDADGQSYSINVKDQTVF